jgi:hypothetical protein
MAPSSQPAPPAQAAPPVVAAFFSEFIPKVKYEYELLEKASDSPLKISLPDLQMETLIFGLHCLDRAVFVHYGAAYRNTFMDYAFATACETFAAVLPDNARDHFIECFKEHCHTRQREYGAMKLLPGSDKGPKGVLSYEYGKRICFDAGVYNPAVVLVMVEEADAIFMMMNNVAQTLQPNSSKRM